MQLLMNSNDVCCSLSIFLLLRSSQGTPSLPSLPTGTIYSLIPLTITSYLGHRPLCSLVLLISLLRRMPTNVWSRRRHCSAYVRVKMHKLWPFHVSTQPLMGKSKAKKQVKEVYHVGMSCLRGQACRITFFIANFLWGRGHYKSTRRSSG